MICPACGIGEVRPTSAAGRRWSHRTIPDLELPAALMIPTCSNCGELWIDEEDAKHISAAAEQAYRLALLGKAEDAVATLRRAGYPQRDLERLLGVSAGYLSKVRGGERDTSAPLVGALMLLAHDPARVTELRNAWSTHPAPIANVVFDENTYLLSSPVNSFSGAVGWSDVIATAKVGAKFHYYPAKAANERQQEAVPADPMVANG